MKKALKKAVFAVLPHRAGNAGCAPLPYTEKTCIQGKHYHRTCQTPPNCGPDTCGPWIYDGLC